MNAREDRLAAELAARLEGCPEPEQLVEQRQEILDHAASCEACAEALDWLRRETDAEEAGLEYELPAEVEARTDHLLDTLAAPRPSFRWGPLAAAAAVVALIAVGLWQFREPPAPAEPVYREGESSSVRSLVDGALPGDAFRLRWSIDGEVSHYDLWLSTESLDPIAEVKGLVEAEHTIDVESLAHLDPGARLVWQVEAMRPGGARVRSATFVVTLE